MSIAAATSWHSSRRSARRSPGPTRWPRSRPVLRHSHQFRPRGRPRPVCLYDEGNETFVAIAADGPLARDLGQAEFSRSVLPRPVGAAIFGGNPLVVSDLLGEMEQVGGRAAWDGRCVRIPTLRTPARAFGVLPLRSRNRLVGMLVLRDDNRSASTSSRCNC